MRGSMRRRGLRSAAGAPPVSPSFRKFEPGSLLAPGNRFGGHRSGGAAHVGNARDGAFLERRRPYPNQFWRDTGRTHGRAAGLQSFFDRASHLRAFRVIGGSPPAVPPVSPGSKPTLP